MKNNFIHWPSALGRRVPACLFVVASFMWALTSAAQAGFTNQPPGAIPAVCNSSVAWGDYDNDGDLDLALTGLDSGDVPISRIFTNHGGFFTAGPSFPGVYLSVVAWGDYDNDGNLDLLLAGATSLTYPYGPICRLYHNRGDGTFENSGAGLPGVYGGGAAWGDYDKDGDLDLVLTGWSEAGRISRIYRNDGGGVFVDAGMALPGVSYGSVAWGDYDNDGYLDLVLCGSSSSGRITRLYRNNGNGTFSDSGIALTGVTTGAVGWGDYDNDGDLDLFVTGVTSSSPVSLVYTNHGNGTLTDSGMVLIGLASSAGAWADYDNDGDLDLVLTGSSDNGLVSILYTNHGNGTLTVGEISLPGMASGSVAWGDFDNSGQIDLLLTGFDTNYSAAIYLGRNTGPFNRPPAVLTNLTTRLSGRDVTLSWAPGSDDHTPGSGLHYNLHLGTFPGGGNRVAPMADAVTGYRRVVRLGNAARTNAWTVKGLPDGTYYWSAQAIDGAFAGGPFARETSFTVPSNPPTDISLTPPAVTEDRPVGTVVGKFAASDLNADDTHIFTLVAGLGDVDNSSFGISAEDLTTAAVFDFESKSSYHIRVRATDPGGLYVEKPFTITVLDANEPPQARCQDVTVVAGANGTASASVNNGSFDPDAGDAVALSQSPPGPYPAGTNLVMLTATDSRGASNSCVATVIVRDLTPPSLSCPASLRLEAAPGDCGVALSYYSVVIASDNCDPAPVITSIPAAGTYLPVGRTNVLVTVSDASGNTTSGAFIVSVYPAGTEVAGAQWRECQTIAEPEPRAWRALAASSTGLLIGAINGGRLQLSKDFGTTWSERENSRNWQAVAVSTNGMKLAAVAFGGQIYVSGDSGDTWAPRENNRNWTAIACSADGTQLAAAVYGGLIYTSADGGVSWTPRESSRAWASIASSADGGTIAAAVRDGPIYISADAGANWVARATDTNRLWSSIACSSGGDFMVAAVSDGQIYTSIDLGSTWTPRTTARSWSAVACAEYSLIIAAVNGGQLYTSTDLGQTWTNRETDRSWSSVAVSPGSDLLFATVNAGHVYASRDRGATWDVAAMTRFWVSIASSADGTKWVAADNGGQIHTSIDSGSNWVARATNRWYAVASSADGIKLLAAADGGQLYTSADSGLTWTPRDSNRPWRGVASSADGVKLAAAAYGGQICTSADSGETWTPRDSNRNWSSIASSADGTKLVATVNGGRIYTSTNSGLTWTPRDAVRSWSAVASSADGSRLIAAVIGGRIYTSADSGQIWTPRETNRQWSAVASSAEGTRLAAVDQSNGLVYLSTDSGLTWSACGSNRNWQTVACSADGMKLAAGVYGGRIYASLPTISLPTVPTILGATNRVVGGTSVAGAVVTFDVTASNTCQPNVPVICTPPSGSRFPFGIHTVVCVAVDAFGAAVTNSFTITVVERPEQGGWRQALALDGLDDRISVTNMLLSSLPLTIELWAKRQSVGTWDAFLGQGAASAGQGLLFGFRDDDRVVFSFSEADLLTTNTYTDSAWHHWAATYDPAAGRCLYRDGILVATDTNAAPYTGTGTLLIGSIPWADDAAFGGILDDVRIWNIARTADEIRLDMLHPLTGSNPRVVAYWNFNLDADGTVFDATLNANNGTVVGSPDQVGSSVPPWGYSLDFDGVDDFVDLPDGVYFSGDFTIEAWVFPRAYNYWSRILDFGNGAPSDNVLLGLSEQNSGKPSLHVFRGMDQFVTAPAPVPTNQWVHLAATLSGNVATLYVNGLPVASGNMTAPNGVVRTNNFLGRSPWGQDGYLAGFLDEVRIWKVARTPAEIQAGLSRHLATEESGLVACWSFDEGTGIDVLDASANLSDGTLVNGPAWAPSTVGRAPAVTTLIADTVMSDGTNAVATLNGLVNPNMGSTSFWFEWGATTAYGNRTPRFEIGSGLAAICCSNVLAGLTAGQTYHYRLVAENSFGVAEGADQVVSPLLITLRGTDPLFVPANSTFVDPGFDVLNAADLQLGARTMAAGSWHNLVIGPAGTVLGWGLNDSGQPTVPASLGNVAAIAAGGYHSLAVSADGRVVAWGNNDYGQAIVPHNATNVTDVKGGYFHSLALRRDGTVVAWGAGSFSGSFPYFGQTMVPASATNIMAIAAGGYHSLALTSNRTVVAWGLNNEGQLNIPATATNVIAIAAGHGHNLALRGDGRMVAWGNNFEGQTIVPAVATNIVAIAANGWHSLALKDDGTVLAWGAGTSNTGIGLSFGQCMVPADTSNVVALAAGLAHSLALRADGSLVAWGDNRYGQTQGLSITPGGSVDTRQPGVYTLTYAVNNAFGWATTTTRSVRVVDRPVVKTEPVINVTSGTVALHSIVTPNGLETFAWFQWGATTNYGGTSAAVDVEDGFAPAGCSIQLADLTPEATYHYRVVASNSVGTVYGPDSLFTVFSTHAALGALSLGEASLSPPFAPDQTSYVAIVPNEVGYLILNPTTADDGATIRVRVNGGSFSPVASGTPSGPLFLLNGTNLIEVQVVAQDGVTTQTYGVTVTRELPSGMLVGPSFPPPMGVTFTESGNPNDDQAGRAEGKTWSFSGASLAAQTLLFWGATNNGVKVSFNDAVFDTNEIMTYQPALSSLADGIVVWTGRTTAPPLSNVYTRFVLAVTNSAGGTALPLLEAPPLGLPSNMGALVRVTPGLAWKAVLRFQASFSTNGPFEPALVFFDRNVATNFPNARAYSSFGAGFFHLNLQPVLGANNPLAVDRGTAAWITSSLLAATDMETVDPTLLKFTIAPQGQGGATRNGTLSLGTTNLASGDSFTQADLNAARLSYVHNGNCETNDDFTFNVTDQHGGVTPTGEHTTYTFRIVIAQPNMPPVALNGSASTGLQAPYHGLLSATNGDCAPQTLTFRLLTQPAKGTISLDDAHGGAFTYVPAASQQGVDSFKFQVNDGLIDAFDAGTFTITISNQPPVAIAASGVTRENLPLDGMLSAIDPDRPAQALTFSLASGPAKGSIVITNAATGGFIYTPNPGAIGADMFAFKAADGVLTSVPAPFTVNIRPNLEDGDLLVSDGGARQIVLVDPAGAQGVVSTGGLIADPRGLAFDPSGSILVLDGVNGLIRVDPISDVQVVVSAHTNFSSAPLGAWGIALEPGGSVLVADGLNGLVRVNPTNGIPTTLAVSNHLVLPVSVALSLDGAVYVGDAAGMMKQSSRIVRIDRQSGTQMLVSSANHLLLPTGIAFDASGDLLVTEAPTAFDGGPDMVLRINATNGNQTVLTASNLLSAPIGIARAPARTFYAVNMASANLIEIDPDTGTQTLFSSGTPLVRPTAITVVQVQAASSLIVGIQSVSGRIEVQSRGLAGRSYDLERSVDLISWQQVTNAAAASDGVARFTDLNPPNGNAFYRVRLP